MATKPITAPVPFGGIQWMVKEGSEVAAGQVVAHLEAGTAVDGHIVQVKSPYAGKIRSFVAMGAKSSIPAKKRIAEVEINNVDIVRRSGLSRISFVRRTVLEAQMAITAEKKEELYLAKLATFVKSALSADFEEIRGDVKDMKNKMNSEFNGVNKNLDNLGNDMKAIKQKLGI